ncbi:MAG: hypothetical protein EH225_00640 [Calditrichaeota bacterium]|nr:hypothetical protein [Calditrichota bacterium]RQW08134.1 MAG: hypothetical protein EH225_00640 [Calditrichota bacterium]
MKIFIAGEDRESSAYIRDALIQTGLDIQLINFDILGNNNLDKSDAAILILNFSAEKDPDSQHLKQILSFVRDFPAPVISFVQPAKSELQQQLEDEGFHPVLELPYSHAEIRLLITGYLKESPDFLNPEDKNQKVSGADDPLEMFFNLMNSMQKNNWNFSRLVRELMGFTHHCLNISHILFLEDMGNSEGLVKNSVSLTWMKSDFKINLKNLSYNQNVIDDLIILENLEKNNSARTYLKSLLGRESKSLIVCPVFLQNQRKFTYLFLNEHKKTFTAAQKRLIYFMRNLSEFALEKEKFSVRQPPDSSASSAIFFQGIIDHLNFGIVIIDRKLGIKFINREASHLLQLKIAGNNYQNLREILGEQNIQAVVDSMKTIDGTFQRPEIELETATGQKLLIGFTLTEYLDPLNEEKVYILSLKDITYTKELQEEMTRMDRLASLGVMASGIAHEIRNPLAGIKAIAQTFEEELAKDDPKNEYVTRIIKQVNRLDDLLKSLFSYAKPQKPNRQFSSVQEIIYDVLSLLKQKLQSQNIKLIQSIQKPLKDVFVDNSQIQQVLFNLVLNSIEAIEGPGEISITVNEIRDDAATFRRKPFYNKITDKPYILIRISDSGYGISPENLQQIFNPFFTTKNFGTGLGLSIVYQIVQENNGIIYFESEKNVGTDCYLFLPAFEPVSKESMKS